MSLRTGFLEPRNIYRNAITTSPPLLAARHAAEAVAASRRPCPPVGHHAPTSSARARAYLLPVPSLFSPPLPLPLRARADPSRAEPPSAPFRPPLAAPHQFSSPQPSLPCSPPTPPLTEPGRAPTPAESACAAAAAMTAPPKVCPAVDLLPAASVFFE